MKKKILISIGIIGILGYVIADFLVFYSSKVMNEAEIKSTFEQIKTGEASNKGEYLWNFADDNTHDFFETIAEDVMELDSSLLSTKGIFYQMLILGFRGQILNKDIENPNGKNLFIHYFNTTSNMASVINDRQLVNISVSRNSATAEMNSKTLPYKQKFIVKFSKKDKWKYDYSTYLLNNEYAVSKILELSNKPVEKYLQDVIRQKGIPIDIQDLYRPINKK